MKGFTSFLHLFGPDDTATRSYPKLNRIHKMVKKNNPEMVQYSSKFKECVNRHRIIHLNSEGAFVTRKCYVLENEIICKRDTDTNETDILYNIYP